MTNPMTMVERVARAIQDVDVIAVMGAPMSDDVWRKLWADSEMRVMTEPYALAAIEAMREPTEAMEEAIMYVTNATESDTVSSTGRYSQGGAAREVILAALLMDQFGGYPGSPGITQDFAEHLSRRWLKRLTPDAIP